MLKTSFFHVENDVKISGIICNIILYTPDRAIALSGVFSLKIESRLLVKPALHQF